MAEDLVLDTAIRDWVLIPLSVVMVLIGVLRYFVSKLMRSSSQSPDPKVIKEGQVIVRARNLRAAANFIPAKSFRARKAYFSNEENGLLFVPKGQASNPQAQMFSDPNMAMDMMKKNLSMIIPQESLVNSAAGMLLSTPDSLVVSISKNHAFSVDDETNTALVSTPCKSCGKSFGIDGVDLLNWTYKVSWPLELIANMEPIKKISRAQSMATVTS